LLSSFKVFFFTKRENPTESSVNINPIITRKAIFKANSNTFCTNTNKSQAPQAFSFGPPQGTNPAAPVTNGKK